ncbi:MAG: putative membrane protein YfcA [Limisphaerales bacterium]|jgi:uncharacterized membrane protein YfcA
MNLLDLDAFDLSQWQWVALFGIAFLYGLSKGGIKGIGAIGVPVMALIFGGKVSTGIVLPMLIVADIPAVLYYKRFVNKSHLVKLLLPSVLGIIFGVCFGELIPEADFQDVMAILVIFCVLLLFWWDRNRDMAVPNHWLFASILGMAAGFTSMIGNVAGPIVVLYLFANRLSKYEFIGTSAWFFFLINWIKLPMHIWVWKTISLETLPINLIVMPVILLGFWRGVTVVKYIQDQNYRNMVLILTALAAILLFFR